jgi:malate/lactate dehydrogenase
MFYYKFKDKLIFSQVKQNGLEAADEQELIDSDAMIYYLLAMDPYKSRKSFCISAASLLEMKDESLQLLQIQNNCNTELPDWIGSKAAKGQIKAVNTSYSNWLDCLKDGMPKSWRINLVGLGDVGSTLLIGLKLLGERKISDIGIYDIDANKINRWEFESNQIHFPNKIASPKVFALEEHKLFDCDMFVFCVTVGIPALDKLGVDVRMAQFEGNSKIISTYAKKAREAGFKGIFAVVSDPVDLLCKKALLQSNTDEEGNYDFKGMAPEQVRGYGLGVMNARAAYYAAKSENMQHYQNEGRAFGPHGDHLVIADSLENYNDELSLKLTDLARKANLDLRKHGYKPYVAPALSSGAIAIMDTIYGNWHYSATYIGGVYMGARNKLLSSGIVLEQNNLHKLLMERLYNSYKELKSIL